VRDRCDGRRTVTRRTATPTRRTPGQLGTVEQLPSGRWRAFYRRDGRKFTAPHTFSTRAEGTAWLASEFADRTRGTWRDPEAGRITLDAYAADWLASRPDLAPRTLDTYARNVRRWISPRIGAGSGSRGVELGTMQVGDITPAVVRAWYAAIIKTARGTAARQLARDRGRTAHPARVWARAQGMQVATTGKMPTAVMQAWREAGEPQPQRANLRTVVPLDQAGATTAAQAYRVLRAILTTAVTDGPLTTNPCQIKGAGQVAHRERGTALPAEVAQLAALMPPRYAAAVTLAAWSGLRYRELFALARHHVDLDAGTVRVERALEQVPGPHPLADSDQAGRIVAWRCGTVWRPVWRPLIAIKSLVRHYSCSQCGGVARVAATLPLSRGRGRFSKEHPSSPRPSSHSHRLHEKYSVGNHTRHEHTDGLTQHGSLYAGKSS